jgi:hypothetical protein
VNLALSTFILFLILLPGIFFRRFYYTQEFSTEYFKQTFLEIFLSGFIPSILIHALWYFFAGFFGYYVDLELFGNLLTNNPNSDVFNNLKEFAQPILWYHLSMWGGSAAIGALSKQVVRTSGLDRRMSLLRFQNSWHYIFTGEFFEFPNSNKSLTEDRVEDIELVYIDALVQTQEGSVLYEGILVDYELSKEGGLESVSLDQVQRRFLRDDRRKSFKVPKHYQIPGDLLLLKYSEIKNLNLSYYTLDRGNQEDELIVRPVK